ncbi:phosphoribosyltransferase [Gemmiger sp.]|uniref:phosphoribosyltransferase n=1 Tax=Gemmiger sp. TaxID=2049027 RepID=UPI003AF19248
MIEYKKTRSKFWLKIFDDEATHTNISANKMVMGLLQEISPHLISCSPKGWKESSNIPGNYNLWIPNDRMDWEALENVETWAERANQHIWLGTNKNTAPYFCGDEVDYCLAADWNIDLESQKHTIIGEAEYQLKYNLPRGVLSKENVFGYASILFHAIFDCIDCLPIDLDDFIVVSMPSVKEKQNKLAWLLAEHVADAKGALFVKATLKRDKPQMKEQTIEDKIRIWKHIFTDGDMLEFSSNIRGTNILIIDDLYQSGASIWCFAEYLKECCDARTVIAITPVKALKDGGNK